MLPFHAILLLGFALGGHALSDRLWQKFASPEERRDRGGFERAASSALLALVVWISCNWVLCGLGLLDAPPLFALAFASGFAGVVSLLKSTPQLRAWFPKDARRAILVVVALLPLLAWIVYVLYRGQIVPVCNQDALSYHMPLAGLMAQKHGVVRVLTEDDRICQFPINYELIMADYLLCDGGDYYTAWFSTVTYLLYLLFACAMFERWCGSSLPMLGGVLYLASMPVLLLASGTQKNDLFCDLFLMGASLWGVRCFERRGFLPGFLCVLSINAAAGTKVHGVIMGTCLGALFLIDRWKAPRPWPWRSFAILAGCGVVSFLGLGGIIYVLNIVQAHRLAATKLMFTWHYGEWSNWLTFPILIALVPYTGMANSVWVPWKQELWYWPHYEVFFSHFGKGFAWMLLALFPALIVLRHSAGRERRTASIILTGFVLILLPIGMQPDGLYAYFGRFIAFALPALLAWTLIPCLQWAEQRSRWLIAGAIFLLAVNLGESALDVAKNDAFIPLAWVQGLKNKRPRFWWLHPSRASVVVDRLASSVDVVAVDGGGDCWSYPAMHPPECKRRIVFIAPGDGPVTIPDEAKWVIIDRNWHVFWGSPSFKDMGQATSLFGRGLIQYNDLRVYRALMKDPTFRLVYETKNSYQFIFQRVTPDKSLN